MCQIAPALDPPRVRLGPRHRGLRGPLGQGAGETRYLLGPQTLHLFGPRVKRPNHVFVAEDLQQCGCVVERRIAS